MNWFSPAGCLNGIKCKAKGEGGGDGDHPTHHLKCLVNQDLWNNRHTSVKATLAAFIRRVGGSCEVECSGGPIWETDGFGGFSAWVL